MSPACGRLGRVLAYAPVCGRSSLACAQASRRRAAGAGATGGHRCCSPSQDRHRRTACPADRTVLQDGGRPDARRRSVDARRGRTAAGASARSSSSAPTAKAMRPTAPRASPQAAWATSARCRSALRRAGARRPAATPTSAASVAVSTHGCDGTGAPLFERIESTTTARLAARMAASPEPHRRHQRPARLAGAGFDDWRLSTARCSTRAVRARRGSMLDFAAADGGGCRAGSPATWCSCARRATRRGRANLDRIDPRRWRLHCWCGRSSAPTARSGSLRAG